MLKLNAARIRHGIGTGLRWLSSPWAQRNITPETATNIFGCSFGASGWHHLVQTLKEYDANPNLSANESSLGLYLSRFQPKSISELAGITDEKPLPLFVYPWGTFTNGESQTSKNVENSRFCGPSTQNFIQDEFARTLSLYKNIRKNGYSPVRYPHSHICGTWLINKNGEERFVVMQGNHRMAVLAHLRATTVQVRTSRLSLRTIYENQIDEWIMVKKSFCSRDHAKKVFDLFFHKNGIHIQNRILTNQK